MIFCYARAIDSLGRIVLPKKIRNELSATEKSIFEVSLDTKEQTILLKKTEPGCTFCGKEQDLIAFRSKFLCKDCLDKIKPAEK